MVFGPEDMFSGTGLPEDELDSGQKVTPEDERIDPDVAAAEEEMSRIDGAEDEDMPLAA